MPAKDLTIGQLARQTAVGVETIRYYQRLGLVAEPPKPREGYRLYPAASIVRIRFIKRAQQLGFTLQEIAELLELGSGCCADVRARAEAKRDQIDAQIRDLKSLRRTLDGLIGACSAGSTQVTCPIVESLTQPDNPTDSPRE